VPTLADYPFDPKLEGREAEYYGLEKLRCIRDASMRTMLFALWSNARPDAARRRVPPEQTALPLDPKAPVIGKDPRLP
jgi:hypothetical protein